MASRQPRFLRRAFNTAKAAIRAAQNRRVPFQSIEWIERIQRRRLQSMIRHAYATVPYYRRVMDERGLRPVDFKSPADLEKLPLLDDLLVRRDMAQFLSTRYFKGSGPWTSPSHVEQVEGLLALQTSGAYSRVRKCIYLTHDHVLERMAYAERDRAVLGHLVGKGWGQVQLFLLPDVSMSIVQRKFYDRHLLVPRGLAQRHYLSTHDGCEETMKAFNAIRPQLVFCYGSYADELFRYIADRRLEIVPPRVVMYGADMLSDAGRRLIESYGCLVYSTYQSVETGRLGFQCELRKGFHLNTDLCAVRLVDSAGKAAAPGQGGEVVISNLVNRATVLLNYRLGDMGIMSGRPCPCGRSLPLLEEMQGKVNAIISLPDGRILNGGLLEMILEEELADTLQAQAVQAGQNMLLWRIVPAMSADQEALRRRVAEKTRVYTGPEMDIQVQFVDKIPYTPAGKFQRVVGSSAAAPETNTAT